MELLDEPISNYTLEELHLLARYFDGTTLPRVKGDYLTPEFFISLENFHNLIKEDPLRKYSLMIPFNDIPLMLGRFVFYKYWHSSIVKWRLQIGK